MIEWFTLASNDTGKIGPRMVAALDGVMVRNKYGNGQPIGTLAKNEAGGLDLVLTNGRREPFTGEFANVQEFAIPRDRLDRVTSGEHQAEGDAPSQASKLAILAKVPAWARRTVAEHLLPAEVAAHDRAQKDARVAQLQALGKAARGGGIPGQKAPSAGQADRVAQLQQIGRMASGR